MHKYIEILEYAFKTKEFTKSEAEQALGLTDEEFDRYIPGNVANHAPNGSESGENQKWMMHQEAFINYLEYIELNEARQSSKEAKKLSLFAIGISAILALASIVISVYQLSTTPIIQIDSQQVTNLSNKIDVTKQELAKTNKFLAQQFDNQQRIDLADKVDAIKQELISANKQLIDISSHTSELKRATNKTNAADAKKRAAD